MTGQQPSAAVVGRIRQLDRVVLLGASGWFGRTMIDLLEQAYGDRIAERTELFARRSHQLSSPAGRELLVEPLGALASLEPGPATLLVDCAYPTQEQVTEMGDGPYVAAVAELRDQVDAALERLRPLACVSLSSGAARLVADGRPVAHRTQLYGEMKLRDEQQRIELCPQLGVRLCIARVYAVSGPHMTKSRSYALGDLIAQARSGGPVELRAGHPVRRSYSLAADILSVAVLTALDCDVDRPELFETGGEVVDLSELARRVAAQVAGRELALALADADGSPADEYFGDPARFDQLAESYGLSLADLDEQIRRTAADG